MVAARGCWVVSFGCCFMCCLCQCCAPMCCLSVCLFCCWLVTLRLFAVLCVRYSCLAECHVYSDGKLHYFSKNYHQATTTTSTSRVNIMCTNSSVFKLLSFACFSNFKLWSVGTSAVIRHAAFVNNDGASCLSIFLLTWLVLTNLKNKRQRQHQQRQMTAAMTTNTTATTVNSLITQGSQQAATTIASNSKCPIAAQLLHIPWRDCTYSLTQKQALE